MTGAGGEGEVRLLALLLLLHWVSPACSCSKTGIHGETDASDVEVIDTQPDTSIPDIETEEPVAGCGNGIRDTGEYCDGDDLGGRTCEALGWDGGTLGCNDDCTYEESRCGDLPECVRFVDIDTTAFSPDGLSWATAVPDVQHGIYIAAGVATEEVPCEVWVAEGTYHIYRSSPEDTVQLCDHVHLYGGFEGDEYVRMVRDWGTHETVLSGQDRMDGLHRVFHVVWGFADDSIIDGFTITGGHASGGESHLHLFGAGMLIFSRSQIVRNCLFTDNVAGVEGLEGGGGGMYCGSSYAVVENCTFSGNRTYGYGGGLYLGGEHTGSSLEITGCLFESNRARYGGAICAYLSRLTVVDSVFSGNEAATIGGGVLAMGRSATAEGRSLAVENSVFFLNSAGVSGGALDVRRTRALITNCTVYDNVSDYLGGGLYCADTATATVWNSIFWMNTPSEIEVQDGASMDIGYSALPGGWEGAGMIDENPLFIEPDDMDLRLRPGSPCIDAANGDEAPASDIDANPRYDDPVTPNAGTGSPPYVDMGAFEYTP